MTCGRPHVIDCATVVVAKKRARLLPRLVQAVSFCGFQVRLDEFDGRHVEMPCDPFDVVIIEHNVHGLAAVGAASAIEDLERSLVQLRGKFVWIIAIVLTLQAAEKLVVLLIVLLSTPTPFLEYSVVIRVSQPQPPFLLPAFPESWLGPALPGIEVGALSRPNSPATVWM